MSKILYDNKVKIYIARYHGMTSSALNVLALKRRKEKFLTVSETRQRQSSGFE